MSGLSGTLVLSDNGRDDLTVSGNGSFTFDSLLAGGAAYDVTVATYPTGQICSVADGSGTMTSADATTVGVSCTGNNATTASDDFDRTNGSLGPAWTDMSDGGLAISSDAAVGANAGGNSGDTRTGELYTSDQYSQVVLTSTQLTGTEWMRQAVRAQDGGRDAYVGIYFWNDGSPELMLFLRQGESNWTLLGTHNCAPLSARLPAGADSSGEFAVVHGERQPGDRSQ